MSKTDALSQEWEAILTATDEADPSVGGVIRRQGRGSKTLDGSKTADTPPKGSKTPEGVPTGSGTEWKVYTKAEVLPHVKGAMSLATELAGVTPYTEPQVDLTAACVAPVATKYQNLFIDEYPEAALLLCVAIMGGIKYMEWQAVNREPKEKKPPEILDEM